MATVGMSAAVPSGSSPAGAPARVVVVGGGLAGLSACIEALEQGAHVTLVDKQPSLGGNSAKATSGINGANTWYQQAKGIPDTPDKFKSETLSSGRGLCDESLVSVLSRESAGALEWLSSPKGQFKIDLSALAQLGGHSLARTHRVPPGADGRPVPVGFTIIRTLSSHLEGLKDSGRLHIRTATSVTGIDIDDNTKCVRGVRVVKDDDKQDEVLAADAVVLTTGGYAYGSPSASPTSEESLLHRYAPSTQKLPTTNGPFATGDGVKLGVSLGAEVSLMEHVQVHPTAFSGGSDPLLVSSRNKFLAPEALRGCGGILVDHEGRRFVNELDYRDKVTSAMLQHCRPLGDKDVLEMVEAYVVLNDEAATAFGKPTLGFYQSKGLVSEYANAGATPLPHLAATLEEYNTIAQAGKTDPFGKSSFPVTRWSASEALYLCPVTPAIHYTMGGLRIDPQARVQWRGGDGSLRPFSGLYAAGEVTGGLHGANRLGGNSLLECVVFGRIAGAQAARAREQTSAA